MTDLEAWREQMRTVIACFFVLLGCSCRPTPDDSVSAEFEAATRLEAVHEIITHRPPSDNTAVLKGPLSIEEVEGDLDEYGKKFFDEDHPMIFGGPDWDRMKADLRPDDELYFFRSDRRSWAELLGWEGYIAIRGKTVTDTLTLSMN